MTNKAIPTFSRIAILNRGEPAIRFLRALREYNIENETQLKSIAFYTTPDQSAPFVRLADESYHLGDARRLDSEGNSISSYCHHDSIIDWLKQKRCDALWPGWGFLSEDASFVEKLEQEQICFIGPSSQAMYQLGDKIASKQLAERSEVPLGPWYLFTGKESKEELLREAGKVGYPLMIKASAGGGGRGIRKVENPEQLPKALQAVQKEIREIFGQGGLFFEACIENARHIEVQIVADHLGKSYALGVRDCSIQRRHQKVIEETPSPILPSEIEKQLCEASVRLVEGTGYSGVGTVEFLYAPATQKSSFLEVNSRLQVEHTITEMITGCDLVKAQIDIAREIPWNPPESTPNGHCIEVRLNAEDPKHQFRPSPGKIKVFRPASGPGIRVDSGVAEDLEIAQEFDSMIAKVIAWAPTRKQAIARLRCALESFQTVVEDGATNKAFLMELLQQPEFVSGSATTTWLDQATEKESFAQQAGKGCFEALLVASIIEYRLQWVSSVQRFFAQTQNGIPQSLPSDQGLQLDLQLRNSSQLLSIFDLGDDRYLVGPKDSLHHVRLEQLSQHSAFFYFQEKRHQVLFSYGKTGITVEVDGTMHTIQRVSKGTAKAPAPGIVVHIAVEEGQEVTAGTTLCTLEAMKMELHVVAQENGQVHSILCRPNQQVKAGQSLLIIQTDEEGESSNAPISAPEAPIYSTDLLFQNDQLIPEVLDKLTPKQAEYTISRLVSQVESVMKGFDIPPNKARKLEELLQKEVNFTELKHPERWLPLARCLEIFADLESLFDRSLLQSSEQSVVVSAEQGFYEFCRKHHEGEKAAQENLKPLLQKALEWYEIHSLESSEKLREAMLRVVMAHTHAKKRHILCSSLLRMLMGLHAAGVSLSSESKLRHILLKIAQVARKEYPFVTDNARQAHYLLFEQSRYVKRHQQLEELLTTSFEKFHSQEDSEQAQTELLEKLKYSQHSLTPLLIEKINRSSPLGLVLFEAILFRIYAKELTFSERKTVKENSFIAGFQPKDSAQKCCGFLCPAQELDTAIEKIINTATQLPTETGILELLLQGKVEEQNFEEKLDLLIQKSHPQLTPFQRVTVSWSPGKAILQSRTYRSENGRLCEQEQFRNLHPEAASRIELDRLDEFYLKRLDSHEHIYAFQAVAKENKDDFRILIQAELYDVPRDQDIDPYDHQLWEFEQRFFESLRLLRDQQSRLKLRKRLHMNRLTLYIRPILSLNLQDMTKLARRFEPATRGLGLQKIAICAKIHDPEQKGKVKSIVFSLGKRGRHRLEVHRSEPSERAIHAMSPYEMKVVRARRLGCIYPYEIISMLEGLSSHDLTPHEDMSSGHFIECDLNKAGKLQPVKRNPGLNKAAVVVGLIRNYTTKHPEGMERIWIASDPTRAMGALAEPECRRILAAFDLAKERQLPVEWIPISAGAKISMDSGTENLDWTARVLKKIISFTQEGGEINLLISGVNVGAQSYWNAESTMLMHTKGALIMTPEASMVLTGKKALDYSGGVSAENERGIGGFERIMGPNGQAQYLAENLGEAYSVLFKYYRFTYQKPGETRPRKHNTTDPIERSVSDFPYQSESCQAFKLVGEIFDSKINPGRKTPFAIRAVMKAVKDQDSEFLERYQRMRHAETAVVWDTHVGGWPLSLLGFESRPLARKGRIPMDGPDIWTGGTLFPQSSKKIALAINRASGNRPVVILANLSGFDGSPESLRKLQLEMGAEIGRAVTNFQGPLVFVVIGRYHGGAYVVFSKALNPNLTAIALEGSYASVIGGAPAAAVVFTHEVRKRAQAEPTVQNARQELNQASSGKKPRLREQFEKLYSQVMLEKQGEVAREFDQIHTVERAVEQGSLDQIISPKNLRSKIVDIISRHYE